MSSATTPSLPAKAVGMPPPSGPSLYVNAPSCHIKPLPPFSAATAGNRWSLTRKGGGVCWDLTLLPPSSSSPHLFLPPRLSPRNFSSLRFPTLLNVIPTPTHIYPTGRWKLILHTAAHVLVSAIFLPNVLHFISTKQKQASHVHMSDGARLVFLKILLAGRKWSTIFGISTDWPLNSL